MPLFPPLNNTQIRHASWIFLRSFRFEDFTVNRFEQLCINYANEKLQQKFTQDVFRTVQAEYESEGIGWEQIGWADNDDVLELVEGPLGLVNILDEQCRSAFGTDEHFTAKLTNQHKGEYYSALIMPFDP